MGDGSKRRRYDVAVVGAGPAGCTAALLLARAGLRTALLEREALPRYKTCGGGLVRRAVEAMPVDLSPAIDRVFHEAACNHLDAGLSYTARRREPVLYTAMRDRLDALLAGAARTEGAEVLESCRVERVEAGAGRVQMHTSGGSVEAGFVVAADGVHGDLARLAGFRDDRLLVPALEWEVRVPPEVHARFAVRPRFDFGTVPNGYAWVFPKRDHLSVGVIRARRGTAHLRLHLERYLESIGVKPVEDALRHGHLVPLRPRRGPFVRDRILLVGDAAGLADPVTAEGISWAVESGRLAARALASGEGEEARVRDEYEGALRRKILLELKVARLAARLLYGPPAVRRTLFRLRGRGLTEAVMDVFTGKRTYRSLLRDPANYAGILRP